MKKVLVVDDDPNIVELLEARLSSGGYEVITAKDGEEALHQAKECDPDLVVADLMMPNVNGWQLAQKLKDMNTEKKVPIILLSAMIRDEGDSGKAEVGDYLMPKPFDAKELMEKINELLEKN